MNREHVAVHRLVHALVAPRSGRPQQKPVSVVCLVVCWRWQCAAHGYPSPLPAYLRACLPNPWPVWQNSGMSTVLLHNLLLPCCCSCYSCRTSHVQPRVQAQDPVQATPGLCCANLSERLQLPCSFCGQLAATRSKQRIPGLQVFQKVRNPSRGNRGAQSTQGSVRLPRQAVPH